MGITKQCQASSYQRKSETIDYGRGDRDQLAITSKDVHQPFSPRDPAQITGSEIRFNGFAESRGQTLYWKLPEKFAGNKVTAYGGTLKYVVKFDGYGTPNQDQDVVLRGNDIAIYHRAQLTPTAGSENAVEVKLFEDRWTREDGEPVGREHLMMALADLDTILIKATYNDDPNGASSLSSVNFEYAEAYGGNGQPALEVEQCSCPAGYVGTSCEDCAPGYARTGGGLYLGRCEKCECNGHAGQCDKEYGFCVDCQHNTEGDRCERCKPGFVGDARRGTPFDCQPAATKPPCQCNNHSPRGCDSFGRCLQCEHNTEGVHCERCKKGYYGDATRGRPDDCTPCPCPGASDCYLDSQGQVACRICPAGLTGRTCEECAPGYTPNTKQDGRRCIPIGEIKSDHIEFIPAPDALLRVQILEPKHQAVQIGERVEWYCQVVSKLPLEPVIFEWQRVGYSILPDGAEDDGRGRLTLPVVGPADLGVYRCKAYTSTKYASDDAHLDVATDYVQTSEAPRPVVDPSNVVTINEGDSASFRCYVPGIPDCQINWHKEYVGGPLPHGVYQAGNQLRIPQAQLKDAGNYVCSATTQYGVGTAPDTIVNVVRPEPTQAPYVPPQVTRRPSKKCDTSRKHPTHPPPPPPTPYPVIQTPPPYVPDCEYPPVQIRVDPPHQTVNENDPARFKCWTPGYNNLPLIWTRPGGLPLPPGAQSSGGILLIPRTTSEEIGQYICQTHNPATNGPLHSGPVTLDINRAPPPAGPRVEPIEQTVDEGTPSRIRCWVPGQPDAIVQWTRVDQQPINDQAIVRDGYVTIQKTRGSDEGDYLCTATNPRDGQPQRAPLARINVQAPKFVQPQIEQGAPAAPVVDPPHQVVDEGEPARIRCYVPGQPDAQIRWSKNERDPLPQHASERNGELTISRTQKADAGTYTCTAYPPNGGPPQSVPATVEVRRPDKIVVEIEPKEQTKEVGEPFYIRCFVPGHPHLKLVWRKVEDDLPRDSFEQSGSLRVPQAQMTDAGDYICSAKDPYSGEIVDSEPAAVIIKDNALPLEDADIVEIHPAHQTVPEHDKANIRCWVQGKPDARLTFRRRDGGPLPDSSNEREGTLYIDDATMADAGKYYCIYHPENGGSPIESDNSRLEVTAAQGNPPKPEASPPLLSLAPGSPGRFICNPNSDTPAKVRWGFGSANGPLRGDVTQEGDDLVINSADEKSIGEYICTATNEFGTGEAPPVRMEITDVEEPPTATVVPRVWNGKPGDRHQFTCVVTGNPTPEVSWIGPNGSPLAHDVTEMEGNKLDFANGRSELNGEYTCTARNSVGEASDHGTVLIGPTLHVTTNPPGTTIVVTVGQEVKIECIATGSPGDPEPSVEWLHDPGPERGDLPDDWVPITISEQFLHHPSIGLGNSGMYTCKGTSDFATASKNIFIKVEYPEWPVWPVQPDPNCDPPQEDIHVPTTTTTTPCYTYPEEPEEPEEPEDEYPVEIPTTTYNYERVDPFADEEPETYTTTTTTPCYTYPKYPAWPVMPTTTTTTPCYEPSTPRWPPRPVTRPPVTWYPPIRTTRRPRPPPPRPTTTTTTPCYTTPRLPPPPPTTTTSTTTPCITPRPPPPPPTTTTSTTTPCITFRPLPPRPPPRPASTTTTTTPCWTDPPFPIRPTQRPRPPPPRPTTTTRRPTTRRPRPPPPPPTTTTTTTPCPIPKPQYIYVYPKTTPCPTFPPKIIRIPVPYPVTQIPIRPPPPRPTTTTAAPVTEPRYPPPRPTTTTTTPCVIEPRYPPPKPTTTTLRPVTWPRYPPPRPTTTTTTPCVEPKYPPPRPTTTTTTPCVTYPVETTTTTTPCVTDRPSWWPRPVFRPDRYQYDEYGRQLEGVQPEAGPYIDPRYVHVPYNGDQTAGGYEGEQIALETTDENDILASNSENQQEAYELPVSEERPEAETADTEPDFHQTPARRSYQYRDPYDRRTQPVAQSQWERDQAAIKQEEDLYKREQERKRLEWERIKQQRENERNGNSRWPETTTYKYTYQPPYGDSQNGRYPGQKVNKGTIEGMLNDAANQQRYPNQNDRYDDRYGKQQGRYPGQTVPKGTVEGMIKDAAREQRYPKRNAGSYRENTRYIATVTVLGGNVQLFDLGEPAELTCAATGSNLVDRIEWSRVQDQLPQDVEEHNEQGVLHFPSFKANYAGEYECRGFRGSEVIATSTVHVHPSSEDVEEARVTIDPPRVRVVTQGDAIVLNCAVEGAKGNEHFAWHLLRGGQIIRNLAKTPRLHIAQADAGNDYGVYKCEIEDDNAQVIGAAYAAVTIGHSAKKPAEMKFDENAEAVLNCPVYTVPGSKVEWSRQDGDMPSKVQQNQSRLVIKDFDDDTAGLYVCKVNIDNHVVEGYVDAMISVPDTIIQVLLEPSSENVQVGDRLWFDCKVTGDDTANVTWVREGEDSLPDNAQVAEKRLQFTAVREDNSGTYKCVAKTRSGHPRGEDPTELGGGAARSVSIFRVDDGLMHNVLAIRKGRDGALFVDEFPPVNGSGVPDLKFMTGGLHRANFDGCVADVTLNGDKMDLMGSAVDGRNVRPCDEWVAPKRFLHRHRRDADWPPLTKTAAAQIDAALDLRIRSRHRWGRKEKFFF
ncbi:unnamed protein product, partial [Mesorhabditis spiculigera]